METRPALIQAATQFLASLSGQRRAEAQAEVHRFVQWCGQDRSVATLTALEVANYAESRSGAPDAVQRLEPVRTFLQFVKKEGFTTSGLAQHLRARKIVVRASKAQSPQAVVVLTREGRSQVEQELVALRAKRPYLAAELKRAAADKDFRENAPLEIVREELGLMESRIRELEALLRGGVIAAAPSAETAKVAAGSSVRIQDMETGEEMAYTVVGPKEAAPARGLLSSSSPVGQAVLGHSPGDVVEVATPAGRFRYRILSVNAR